MMVLSGLTLRDDSSILLSNVVLTSSSGVYAGFLPLVFFRSGTTTGGIFGICGTTLVASNGLRFLGFRPFAEEVRAAPCCSSMEIEEEKEGKLSEVEARYEAFDGKVIETSDSSSSSSSSSSQSSKEFSD